MQLVDCLTAFPRVESSMPAGSHSYTFLTIDHENIFTVILLLLPIQEGLLSVTSESMWIKYEGCPLNRGLSI